MIIQSVYSPEECASLVKAEKPNATSSKYVNPNTCYAQYNSTGALDSSVKNSFTCIFKGKNFWFR